MYTDFNLEVSSVCNLDCIFCNYHSTTRDHKFMDTGSVRNCLHKMQMFNPSPDTFNLTGLGEPLLNPDFFSIVELVRKFFPDTRIAVNTNCINLTKNIIKKICDSSLDTVCCSIRFTSRKKFLRMCKKNSYFNVVENVRYFLAFKGNRSPNVHLQVFGFFNALMFYLQWFWRLNKNDSITVEHCLDLKPGSKLLDKKIMAQKDNVLYCDIDGNLFFSCLAPWSDKPEKYRINI